LGKWHKIARIGGTEQGYLQAQRNRVQARNGAENPQKSASFYF
jgi:hypothetical protein